MKISPSDKLQAIKHSKEYRNDYFKYDKERERTGIIDFYMVGENTGEKAYILSELGKQLCKKWNIRFPVNPDAEYVKGGEACVHSPVTYLDPLEQWKQTVLRAGKDGRKENITHVNDKLVLMIDTSYSIDQITQEINKILSFWIQKSKTRIKQSKKIDIWQVFDEIDNGKKVYQVAKEYAAKRTKPGSKVRVTEDEIQLIRDSYKKAQKIISAVEKENQTVSLINSMKNKNIKPSKKK